MWSLAHGSEADNGKYGSGVSQSPSSFPLPSSSPPRSPPHPSLPTPRSSASPPFFPSLPFHASLPVYASLPPCLLRLVVTSFASSSVPVSLLSHRRNTTNKTEQNENGNDTHVTKRNRRNGTKRKNITKRNGKRTRNQKRKRYYNIYLLYISKIGAGEKQIKFTNTAYGNGKKQVDKLLKDYPKTENRIAAWAAGDLCRGPEQGGPYPSSPPLHMETPTSVASEGSAAGATARGDGRGGSAGPRAMQVSSSEADTLGYTDFDRLTVASALLHGADLSSPGRPWKTCQMWVERLLKEFKFQAEQVRAGF